MGKALEFLGKQGCATVFASLINVVTSKGSAYDQWFSCPFHGVDKTPSAHYDSEQDVYHCFSCGAGGDLINFYTDLNNMDETEGFFSFLGAFCPERIGKKPEAVPKIRKAPVAVQASWVPDAPYLPPLKWREKADRLLRECADELQNLPDVLAQLDEWGIDAETAKKCLIGWNSKDRYYPVTSVDLPYSPAKSNPKNERKIWWPVGLVFASFRDGLPAKVKIRADKPLDFMPRYFQIYAGSVPEGLRSPYLIAGDHKYKIWVIVETDRDAYLGWASCRGLPIGFMAVGSAGARPDAYAAKILREAELILCALDNDAAGRQFAWSFWDKEFPLSRRWPVPTRCGKDIGDAVRPLSLLRSEFPLDDFYNMALDSFYLDIRKWVLAGISARVWRYVRFNPPVAPVAKIEAVSVPALPISGPSSDVLLLSDLMRRHKIGLRLGDGLSLVEPSSIVAKKGEAYWQGFTRISSLVFGESKHVNELLDSLPDGTFTAASLLKPWLSSGWKPAGGSR